MRAPPKVFIVDDDEAVRDSLKVLLESHGIRADSFKSAMDFARDYQPGPHQCLIQDRHMPHVTGAFLDSAPHTNRNDKFERRESRSRLSFAINSAAMSDAMRIASSRVEHSTVRPGTWGHVAR
jgi:DNA-binding NtrC family response regulator